eukprot:365801-Chlamydomonas_euryale.AAC.4
MCCGVAESCCGLPVVGAKGALCGAASSDLEHCSAHDTSNYKTVPTRTAYLQCASHLQHAKCISPLTSCYARASQRAASPSAGIP